jgi:hypothetical protein
MGPLSCVPGLGSVGVELAVGQQVLNDLRIAAEGGEIHPLEDQLLVGGAVVSAAEAAAGADIDDRVGADLLEVQIAPEVAGQVAGVALALQEVTQVQDVATAGSGGVEVGDRVDRRRRGGARIAEAPLEGVRTCTAGERVMACPRRSGRRRHRP